MNYNFVRWMPRGWLAVLPLVALFFAGCASNDAPPPGPDPETQVAHFHVGDTVTVVFTGLPNDDLLPHEEPIKEDGTITLDSIGPVKAAGKTAGELQNDIHDLYVPKYYTHLNVTSAGDFTDFANRKKDWLIRANGQRIRVNCDDIMDGSAPDPQVYPGDQIQVTRRLF